MNESSRIAKYLGYALGIAVAASSVALLGGAIAFGLQLDRWNEWQGRLIGVVGTLAGIAGAAVGVWLAQRADTRGTH
jgi:hypothetical protein